MLDNLNKNQKRILIVIIIVVSIGFIYYIYNKIGKNENIDLDENILVTNNLTQEDNKNTQDEQEYVIVHITGSVKTPGIVKLKQGSRIEDAIQSAGGLTENADISKVNLAYVIEDGIKIRIPSLDEQEIEEEDILIEGSGENIIQEAEKDTNISINTNSKNTNKTININKATENELQTLPGIGGSLASRIIEYREENGKFLAIEDIKNVSGIGESKYNNIKDLISVR
jgi:competence protein ComEA